MKNILLTALFIILVIVSKSQNVVWTRQASDAGLSRALGISSDPTGNLYVAGTVSPPTVLDTISLTPLGGYDAYVAKYDRNGNIKWAISFGGSNNDEAFDIATDNQGNSFVTGYVGTNAVIGGQSFNSSYSVNFFIVKVDANGIIQWVKFFDNAAGNSEGKAVAVHSSRQIVAVTGFFTGSADLDSVHITGNYEDVFTARIDGITGNVEWVKKGGGSSDDEGQGIAVDNAGNILSAGYYKANATFDSVSFPAAQDHDIYLIKYDSHGNLLWAKHATGPGHDDGYKVKTDNYDNVYLEGNYENGVNFDGNIIPSAGGFDGYLNKYDSNGNLKWIIHGGGSSANLEVFSGFTFDNFGYLWCTGFFSGPAMIDTFHVNAQASDIVLFRIDTSGQILNVLKYGGPGNDYGYAVSYAPECFIAVAGSFSGTANFGLFNMTSGGLDDACVVQVDATCTIGIREQNSVSNISVYPNPFTSTIQINSPERIEGSCKIYNAMGACVMQKKFSGEKLIVDLTFLSDGIYEMEIASDQSAFYKRIIKW